MFNPSTGAVAMSTMGSGSEVVGVLARWIKELTISGEMGGIPTVRATLENLSKAQQSSSSCALVKEVTGPARAWINLS